MFYFYFQFYFALFFFILFRFNISFLATDVNSLRRCLGTRSISRIKNSWTIHEYKYEYGIGKLFFISFISFATNTIYYCWSGRNNYYLQFPIFQWPCKLCLTHSFSSLKFHFSPFIYSQAFNTKHAMERYSLQASISSFFFF